MNVPFCLYMLPQLLNIEITLRINNNNNNIKVYTTQYKVHSCSFVAFSAYRTLSARKFGGKCTNIVKKKKKNIDRKCKGIELKKKKKKMIHLNQSLRDVSL